MFKIFIVIKLFSFSPDLTIEGVEPYKTYSDCVRAEQFLLFENPESVYSIESECNEV